MKGIEIPFEQKVILKIYPIDDNIPTYSNSNIFIRRRFLEYQYSSVTLNEYQSNCLYFIVNRGISNCSTYNSIDIHIPDQGFDHYIQINSPNQQITQDHSSACFQIKMSFNNSQYGFGTWNGYDYSSVPYIEYSPTFSITNGGVSYDIAPALSNQKYKITLLTNSHHSIHHHSVTKDIIEIDLGNDFELPNIDDYYLYNFHYQDNSITVENNSLDIIYTENSNFSFHSIFSNNSTYDLNNISFNKYKLEFTDLIAGVYTFSIYNSSTSFSYRWYKLNVDFVHLENSNNSIIFENNKKIEIEFDNYIYFDYSNSVFEYTLTSYGFIITKVNHVHPENIVLPIYYSIYGNYIHNSVYYNTDIMNSFEYTIRFVESHDLYITNQNIATESDSDNNVIYDNNSIERGYVEFNKIPNSGFTVYYDINLNPTDHFVLSNQSVYNCHNCLIIEFSLNCADHNFSSISEMYFWITYTPDHHSNTMLPYNKLNYPDNSFQTPNYTVYIYNSDHDPIFTTTFSTEYSFDVFKHKRTTKTIEFRTKDYDSNHHDYYLSDIYYNNDLIDNNSILSLYGQNSTAWTNSDTSSITDINSFDVLLYINSNSKTVNFIFKQTGNTLENSIKFHLNVKNNSFTNSQLIVIRTHFNSQTDITSIPTFDIYYSTFSTSSYYPLYTCNVPDVFIDDYTLSINSIFVNSLFDVIIHDNSKQLSLDPKSFSYSSFSEYYNYYQNGDKTWSADSYKIELSIHTLSNDTFTSHSDTIDSFLYLRYNSFTLQRPDYYSNSYPLSNEHNSYIYNFDVYKSDNNCQLIVIRDFPEYFNSNYVEYDYNIGSSPISDYGFSFNSSTGIITFPTWGHGMNSIINHPSVTITQTIYLPEHVFVNSDLVINITNSLSPFNESYQSVLQINSYFREELKAFNIFNEKYMFSSNSYFLKDVKFNGNSLGVIYFDGINSHGCSFNSYVTNLGSSDFEYENYSSSSNSCFLALYDNEVRYLNTGNPGTLTFSVVLVNGFEHTVYSQSGQFELFTNSFEAIVPFKDTINIVMDPLISDDWSAILIENSNPRCIIESVEINNWSTNSQFLAFSSNIINSQIFSLIKQSPFPTLNDFYNSNIYSIYNKEENEWVAQSVLYSLTTTYKANETLVQPQSFYLTIRYNSHTIDRPDYYSNSYPLPNEDNSYIYNFDVYKSDNNCQLIVIRDFPEYFNSDYVQYEYTIGSSSIEDYGFSFNSSTGTITFPTWGHGMNSIINHPSVTITQTIYLPEHVFVNSDLVINITNSISPFNESYQSVLQINSYFREERVFNIFNEKYMFSSNSYFLKDVKFNGNSLGVIYFDGINSHGCSFNSYVTSLGSSDFEYENYSSSSNSCFLALYDNEVRYLNTGNSGTLTFSVVLVNGFEHTVYSQSHIFTLHTNSFENIDIQLNPRLFNSDIQYYTANLLNSEQNIRYKIYDAEFEIQSASFHSTTDRLFNSQFDLVITNNSKSIFIIKLQDSLTINSIIYSEIEFNSTLKKWAYTSDSIQIDITYATQNETLQHTTQSLYLTVKYDKENSIHSLNYNYETFYMYPFYQYLDQNSYRTITSHASYTNDKLYIDYTNISGISLTLVQQENSLILPSSNSWDEFISNLSEYDNGNSIYTIVIKQNIYTPSYIEENCNIHIIVYANDPEMKIELPDASYMPLRVSHKKDENGDYDTAKGIIDYKNGDIVEPAIFNSYLKDFIKYPSITLGGDDEVNVEEYYILMNSLNDHAVEYKGQLGIRLYVDNSYLQYNDTTIQNYFSFSSIDHNCIESTLNTGTDDEDIITLYLQSNSEHGYFYWNLLVDSITDNNSYKQFKAEDLKIYNYVMDSSSCINSNNIQFNFNLQQEPVGGGGRFYSS